MADSEGSTSRARKALPSSRPTPFNFASRWAPSDDSEVEEESSVDDDDDDDDNNAAGNANNNMASNANNMMANNANPPALPAPNQGQPQLPFVGQPQAAFAPNQGNPQPAFAPDPNTAGAVLCPLCAPPKNSFRQTSMRLHFQRKHTPQEFQQWFGVARPAQINCPHRPPCNAGPFSRQSDLTDHLSEIHNQVPPQWRLKYNKQKRRQLANLLNDYINEAAALNTLIGRIAAAEASQPGQYVSSHGLPLGGIWQTNPALVTNPALTLPVRREDVANQLITLRNTADQRGLLLAGVWGTWNQVADELEARIAANQAHYGFLGPA